VETGAFQEAQQHRQEQRVEHRHRQLELAAMPRAESVLQTTGGAAGVCVQGTHCGIIQPTGLRPLKRVDKRWVGDGEHSKRINLLICVHAPVQCTHRRRRRHCPPTRRSHQNLPLSQGPPHQSPTASVARLASLPWPRAPQIPLVLTKF